MARGRFVSKQIACCEQLERVSLEAALLFTWCIPHLDAVGRMTGNPTLIKSQVVPIRREITEENVPDLLRSLAVNGLVRWYEIQGKRVLEYPTFGKHQLGLNAAREANKGVSSYPEWSEAAVNLADTYSGPTPDLLPHKIREVKVSLSEESDAKASGLTPEVEQPTTETNGKRVNPLAKFFVPLREYAWLGKNPPQVPGRPDYGRDNEASIIKAWQAAGYGDDEITGIISHAREGLGSKEEPFTKPFTLALLHGANNASAFNASLAAYRKSCETAVPQTDRLQQILADAKVAA